MPPEPHHPSLNVRALLKSMGTPFAAVQYRPRVELFHQGDPADSVMYVEKGRVRLMVTARNGKQAMCGLLQAGAFLGEDALSGRQIRRWTAIAMDPTEVLVIEKRSMIRLLRMHPAAADRFIAHILARSVALEADLTDQLLNSSEQRVARLLLTLAGYDARHPARCVLPDIPQETIADMAGTTRSRVNMFMSRFRKLGCIDEDHGVLHVNPSLQVIRDGGGEDDVKRTHLDSTWNRGAARRRPAAALAASGWTDAVHPFNEDVLI